MQYRQQRKALANAKSPRMSGDVLSGPWEDHGSTSTTSGRNLKHEALGYLGREVDRGRISPVEASFTLRRIECGEWTWGDVGKSPQLTAVEVRQRMDEISPGGWRVADMRDVASKRGRKTVQDRVIRAYTIWLCHWMRYQEGASVRHIQAALGIHSATAARYFDLKQSRPEFHLCRMLNAYGN